MPKLNLKIALLTIICIFSFLSAKASHVVGGDITYKITGKDSLWITARIYRDCNGIALSNSPVTVRSSCTTQTVTLGLTSVRDVTGIPTGCPVSSKCSGGSFAYGIEEHIFSGLYVIPNNSCCKYWISWEQCCRNAAITTGASGTNFFIETTFDKCLAPNNTSPDFLNPPLMIVPTGQDICLSYSAIDSIDNDLITYELIGPLDASGSSIAYSGSFSADKPLTFLGFPDKNLGLPAGFWFDSLSGNMSFRQTKSNEVTVVAVKVKEWRIINGKKTLISEIIRDVQLVFYNSPNNKIPKIDSVSSNVVKACTPGTYCISVPVTDADANDTITVKFKHNLKNLSVNTTTIAPNNKLYQFCFTVDSAMLQAGSYSLTLYANDNACTVSGKAEKTYYVRTGIYSTAKLPKLGTVCQNNGPITLTASPSNGRWSGFGVAGSTSTFYPDGTIGATTLVYSYTDSLSGCPGKDSIVVDVIGATRAGFVVTKSIALKNETIVFTDTSITAIPYQRQWYFGDGATSNLLIPKHAYTINGEYTAQLILTSSVCKPDTATLTIKIGSNYLSTGQAKQNNLKIYPNPANNLLHIQTTENIQQVQLTDILGRAITFDFYGISANETISVNQFENGIYLLTVTDIAGNVYTGKVLVQR